MIDQKLHAQLWVNDLQSADSHAEHIFSRINNMSKVLPRISMFANVIMTILYLKET